MLTGAAARRGVMQAHLMLRAWLGLLAFDLIVLTGFARAHTWVRRCRKRVTLDRHASTDDIIWAIDEACVWYVKRAACLQRSAVATRLLRRRGWPAELVIGYRPTPFESHAWVEVAGVIVNDRPQYQKFFAVLERI